MSEYAMRIATKLTDHQRNCLLFWPGGFFSIATVRALQRQGLIHEGELTALGVDVLAQLGPQP